MNQIPNIEEEFANKLSSSIRYSAGKGQYDALPDCQDAYLDGVETAIAMMYIDLTGTPKSEGMLAKFLHQQLQKARQAGYRAGVADCKGEPPLKTEEWSECNECFDGEHKKCIGKANGCECDHSELD